MKKNIGSLEELGHFAEAFLGELSKKTGTGHAVLVGLTGDLGAGKTAFTKCVAAALGISDIVTSPTFVLQKRYSIPQGGILGSQFSNLIHVDAYRLHKGSELAALDWEATLADKHNLVLLEWPEQVADAMPKDMIKLSFAYVDEGVRSVEGEDVK